MNDEFLYEIDIAVACGPMVCKQRFARTSSIEIGLCDWKRGVVRPHGLSVFSDRIVSESTNHVMLEQVRGFMRFEVSCTMNFPCMALGSNGESGL